VKRFNPFKLADNFIETNYRLPVATEFIGVESGESFMTCASDNTINLGEYLDFLKKQVFALQRDLKQYERYHKAAP
jgi:hypothetical protein